jgi:hypothetical protein
MYITTKNNAGDTFMTCKDCGHAFGINTMCEKPLQSAADTLKHMASHAFALARGGVRPESEIVTTTELAPPLGIPASGHRSDFLIAQLSPSPRQCVLPEFSFDQLRLGEALLTM